MTAPMRLLLVAPMLGRHGRVPDVFETLGPLLSGAGHHVVASSDDPAAARRAVTMARATVRHRRDVDAVVVHLYSGRAFAVEDVVSRLAGDRPLVGYLSGGGFPAFAERHPRWVPRVLDRFAHLVAPSPWLARWAEGVTATPVRVIPNPLDLGPYPYRRRTSVRPTLLWMRAYHEIYAPEVAVRAASTLADRYPDLQLTMVGADKGEQAGVVQLVGRLGLADHVDVGGFAGPDEKQRLLATHDVFVNTARVDNRPVSVVEAGASGLCIVSSRVGGVADLVEDGRSALLVEPDDPEALAAAVGRLVDDPALAARLSAGGRAVAEAGRPEVVLEAWQALLSELG
jgi:glycosyltransferase involved in cell wall biosynthesis